MDIHDVSMFMPFDVFRELIWLNVCSSLPKKTLSSGCVILRTFLIYSYKHKYMFNRCPFTL